MRRKQSSLINRRTSCLIPKMMSRACRSMAHPGVAPESRARPSRRRSALKPQRAQAHQPVHQEHRKQRDRDADRGDRRGGRIEIPGDVIEELDRQRSLPIPFSNSDTANRSNDMINAKRLPEITPGLISGRVMRRKVVNRFAPRLRAASSRLVSKLYRTEETARNTNGLRCKARSATRSRRDWYGRSHRR